MSIKLVDIKVHYPGVRALDGVTIVVRPGEVHGVIGENGAGKSTLMNVLSGSVTPTSGQIVIEGVQCAFAKPADAVSQGISLVSQEGSLVSHLSGAANICLGFEPTRLGLVIRRREMLAIAERARARWFPETVINLDVPVEELPYASQKIIEVLRALHSNPKVLILDEPTATLPAREKERLSALIRKVSSSGTAVMLISHFLSEVLALTDHITALQDGRVVQSLPNRGLTERDLIGLMFNRGGVQRSEPSGDGPSREDSRPTGDALVEVREWRGDGFAVDELTLHAGEIVGLIGLTGAGHFDFAASLYQPRNARTGSLRVNGRDCTGSSVNQSKRNGIAYVPDHRMINALIGDWSVRENLSLINVANVATRAIGLVKTQQERAQATVTAQRLGTRCSSIEQLVSQLSGGNKQKVSIGRWLYAASKKTALFIFVEPTEGVDVGAKHEIHQLIRGLAREGAAVLLASSDLLEIASVVDRVVPFASGRTGCCIPKISFSEHNFVNAIAGLAA